MFQLFCPFKSLVLFLAMTFITVAWKLVSWTCKFISILRLLQRVCLGRSWYKAKDHWTLSFLFCKIHVYWHFIRDCPRLATDNSDPSFDIGILFMVSEMLVVKFNNWEYLYYNKSGKTLALLSITMDKRLSPVSIAPKPWYNFLHLLNHIVDIWHHRNSIYSITVKDAFCYLHISFFSLFFFLTNFSFISMWICWSQYVSAPSFTSENEMI